MKPLLRLVVWLLPAALSLGLLAFVLRAADFGRALGLVGALGPWLPLLLLLPTLASLLVDTTGWWLSFSRLAPRPPFWRLLGVRASADALALGLPSGAVVAETVQPYLLKRRCGVTLEAGIVASVARKFFVVTAHAGLLVLGTLSAWPLLERVSPAAIGRGGLPWLLVACALGLFTIAVGGAVAIAQGRVADRLHRGLARLVGRWLSGWLERHALRFQRTDDALARFFGRPRALAAPLLLHLVGWLLRALETFLFLRLVGIEIPLAAAVVIETSLVLVRVAAAPVPGGLGVQDVGYLLCLRALGVHDATTLGAAFVVLKRGKDLAWVLLGLLTLGSGTLASRLDGGGQPASAEAGAALPPPA